MSVSGAAWPEQWRYLPVLLLRLLRLGRFQQSLRPQAPSAAWALALQERWWSAPELRLAMAAEAGLKRQDTL
jgi:hypothetical protein